MAQISHLIIAPAVGDVSWDSFESASKVIELGEKAALAALPAIKQWLKPWDTAGHPQTAPVALPLPVER